MALQSKPQVSPVPYIIGAQYAPIVASASGATEIVGAVAGHRIVILSFYWRSNGSVNVKWQSGSSDMSGLSYEAASTGQVCPHNSKGWGQTGVNEALNINLSASVGVGGMLVYSLL